MEEHDSDQKNSNIEALSFILMIAKSVSKAL